MLAADGVYEKSEFEDINSITAGITGNKGNVHVHFGDVITEEIATPAELASYIDQQIHKNYQLHDSNLIAANQLDGISEAKQREFKSRFDSLSDEQREIAINMYAKPYFNQQQTSEYKSDKARNK